MPNDEQSRWTPNYRGRDMVRNALSSLGSPNYQGRDMMQNALANMREYYSIPEDEAAERQKMLDYSRYGIDENTEYLGEPMLPAMLPAALAFRGGQSVGQAMQGMGAYSPRAAFMGQARETRPAMQRFGRWMEDEFF